MADIRNVLSPGEIVGRYEILSLVGAGGMGVVYKALDRKLRRAVALKFLSYWEASSTKEKERFLNEARAASALDHPNIGVIHGIEDSSDGISFIVMAFYEGESLAQMIRKGPIRCARAVDIASQMSIGLAHAHDHKIVHRDIKPSNIMVTPQSLVKIVDFGLARLKSDVPSDTSVTAGTICYMSPEQTLGKTADERSDIWSWGVVFAEMITCQNPFWRGSVPATVNAIVAETPRGIEHIPEVLRPIIYRTLAKDPSHRYQRCSDIQLDLESAEKRINESMQTIDLSAPTQSIDSEEILEHVSPSSADLGYKITKQRFTTLITTMLIILLLIEGVLFWRHRVTVGTANKPNHIVETFENRDSIVITDFKNKTGEPRFDRVLADLTGLALGQSNYINIIPRLLVIEAAKKTGLIDVGEIDADLGRQLCIRNNYRALLTGEISKSYGRYRIEIIVMDPRSGSTLLSDGEFLNGDGDLYSAIDRLSFRIRQSLGESPSSLEQSKPLVQVTTTSVEALQRYSLAVDLYGMREFKRSVALAKDALDRDPDFAMAHLLLARAYEELGNETDSQTQFRLARAASGHVGERERTLILAMDYSAQGLDKKASEEYQHLIDIYPDDVDALRGLAESSFWTGRTVEAIDAQRKALKLVPYSSVDYDHMLTLLVRSGRFSEALKVYEEARSRSLDSANLRFSAGLAYWGEGDLNSARKVFDELRDEPSDYWKIVGYLYQGRMLAYEGKMFEADATLRRALLLVERPWMQTWIPVFRYLLARIELVRGRRAQARSESHRLTMAAESNPTPENLQRAGRIALEVGDLNTAKNFRQLIQDKLSKQSDDFTQMHLYKLAGDIDLAAEDISAAVESQEQALTFHRGFEAYLSLGEACEKQHNWKCAIDAYTNFLDLKGQIIRDDFATDWVLAHNSLARVFARSGKPTAAIHSYDEFLKLFALADKDLPVLREAQQSIIVLRTQN